MDYKKIIQAWRSFAESPLGKQVIKLIRISVVIGIFVFLFFQLNKIGWLAILKALPTNPWFYVLFLLAYLALPISEQFIYRLSLKFSFWQGFKVFMIKKILNVDVVAYSGEAYFFAWGKKHLDVTSKYLFNVVKDNNIISSFASTLTAVLLLATLTYFGQINFLNFFTISSTSLIIIGLLALLVLFLAFYFRKKIIAFNSSTALKIFAIHELRIIVVYGLEVLMCVAALPLIPINIWFTFLAIKVISSRVPFLPSQDILLLGIYAKVAELYQVPQAEIMAVYLMITALGKLLNIALYAIFQLDNQIAKPNTEKKSS